MWNDDDRKWLFEQMKKAGVNTGTYEDFTNSLKNQADRDWYYQKSLNLGLKVGSADDFAGMMVEPVTQPQQQTAHAGDAAGTAAQPIQTNVVQPVVQTPTTQTQQGHKIPVPVPKELEYTRMGDQNTFDPVRDYDQYEQAMQLTPQARRVIYGEQKAQQMERYSKQEEIDAMRKEAQDRLNAFYQRNGITDPDRGFAIPKNEHEEYQAILDRMSEASALQRALDESTPKTVAQQLDEAREELARLKRGLKSKRARNAENDALYGNLNSEPSLIGMMAQNSRYDTELAAIRTVEDRIRTLEAEQDDEGQSMFWRGFWDAMRDPSVWSLGVSDLDTSVELVRIKEKMEAGEELTATEQTLLNTTVENQEAEQQYGSNRGFMYRAGNITMNALPFVGEFLLSGGGMDFINAAGKATAKASAKMAAKSAAEGAGKSAINNAATRWIVRNTGVLADDVTRGFLMANTTGAARTTSDILNRHMGQVIETDDGYQFVGGEDWGDAIYHGEVANTLEYYTEMLGAHFGGAGAALDKGLNKIGLSKLSGALNRIKGSQFYQAGDNLLAKGGIHDLIGEGMEEEANLVLNSLLVGDNQLSDLFDGRTQADIWGGMALSLGFMRAPQYAGTGYQTAQYYRYKQKTHNADVVAGYRLTPEKWEPIRERIDNATNEEMADVITDVIGSDQLQQQEKEAVMGYVNNLLQMRGYNMGTMANAKDAVDDEDTESQQSEQAVEQSYSNGYNATDEQQMNDAKNMLDYQRQRIGEFATDDMLAQLDADPVGALNVIRGSDAWTDEEKHTATDYVNAKATYDGMIQHVRDDIDSQLMASDAAIDSHVHNADGMIHPATMKVDDRRVYVIGGNVVMNEDGTVNHENSDESIIIRDAETGNIEFADPRDFLSVDEALDAAQEKQAAQDAIRQEYAQQAADKIDGVLQFNDGDTYTATDEQGQQHTVVVVPNGTANSQGQILQAGEGEALVSVDGAEPAPMSREDIQGMVDATNLARLQQFEQEKAQRRAALAEAQREASRPVYSINDEVTLQTDEGQVRGSITAEANEDGLIEVYTERPIGGKKINLYNRDELDAMLIEHNGAQQQVETPAGEIAGTTAQQADGETQLPPLTNEGIDAMLGAAPAAGTVAGLGENAQEVHGGESGQQPAGEAAGTAAQPMPMIGEGEDAEPDFSKVEPARAHTFIYNEAGLSRDEANQFVEANKKAADKALTTIQGKKPKMGTSLAKYRKDTAEWEQKVAQAQQQADYWKQVKDEQGRIVAAERAAQAERDAQLHEQAVADEQERQAAVIQQREEQAALGTHNVAPAIREKWEAAPKVEGARNELVLANGEKVPGRYVLVESGAATPSHNPAAGFTKNEGFPMDENEQSVNDRDYERDQDAQTITRQIADQYDSRAMQTPVVVSSEGVVLSGNGRTMAGELAAQNGTDGAYIEHLKKYGQQYGFTPEQVEGMQHPRVLFIPDEAMPYTADTFAKFNQQEMKGQSKTEQAVKLGKIVDDDTFGRVIKSINAFDTLGDFYADPAAATEAINELRNAGAISQAQYAEMFDGDTISAQGREILENMLIGKAFESNPDAVRQITAFKGVRQSIICALAEISNNLMLGEGYSLESELAQAIDLVYQARQGGYKAGDKVSGYARQLNLFAFDEGESVADYTNATVLMLADVMNDNRVTRLKKWLTLYNHAAQESANGQMDIFSGGIKSQVDIINDVKQLLNYGTEEEQQTAIDTATQQRTAAASTEQPSGTDAGAEQDGTGSNGDTGNAVASTDESVGGTDAAVASAESETATNPTDGQKEAGNYKKGHVSIDGFDISIENPKGSERSGKDASGRPWSVTMQNTYGYIRRTEGVDGDHIDVFLSDHLDDWNDMVYVVDQVNADGSFDEHKVMYGFNSAEEAAAAYNSNYSEGWQGLGTITGVTKEEFKKWVDSSHRKTKPFAEYKSVKAVEGQSEGTTSQSDAAQDTEAKKSSFLDAVKDLYSKGKEYAANLYKQTFFDVAKTPAFMKQLGLTGDKFTVRYGVLSRHMDKDSAHSLPESVWEQLPEALQRPFAITRYYTDTEKKEQKGYRLYTTLQLADGSFVVVSAEVKNAGKDIEVNAINTVFGRDALSAVHDELIYTAENITPEQQALLNGNNPRQYPAEREQENETSSPNSSEMRLTEQQDAVPDLLPTQGDNVSEDKGTNNSSSEQGNAEKKLAEHQKADGAASPVSGHEAVLRDAVVGLMRGAGIEVSTDWEEGQRVLDEYNGKLTDDLKQMGSRVDSKKKASNQTPQMPDGDTPEGARTNDLDASSGAKVQQNTETAKDSGEKISFHKGGADTRTADFKKWFGDWESADRDSFWYNEDVSKVVDDELRPKVVLHGTPNKEFYEFDESKQGETTDAGWLGRGFYFYGNNPDYARQYAGPHGRVMEVYLNIRNPYIATAEDFNRLAEANSREASDAFREELESEGYDGVYYNGDGNEEWVAFHPNQIKSATDNNGEYSAENNDIRFFKTPDGEAYGYTYKGKIYIDPKIANSETPIHEYGHLWAGMKRASAPEEWTEIKKVLLGDRLARPIIDKVREEYPELTAEGREDDFVEELLTQFSGKRGAERLREVAEQVARERGGVFGKAEAVTAMQRLKDVLNRFWEGVARMMGWKYTSANQIADRIMADMLNGVNPKEDLAGKSQGTVAEQRETERTLMGVHNISEEKLKKALKAGGLANPSLAVIDTDNHMHSDYGEISLIPKSALIDARTGQNAGTWTADAWTPRYPQVQKRMSNKGEERYWKETREALGGEPGDIRSKTMMAFESWMENGTSPERLSYWYLKERGKEPEQVMYEPSMAKDDIEAFHSAMNGHSHFSELDAESRKTVLALIAKEQGITPDELTAKVQEIRARNEQRMEDENVKPFVKMHAERVIGEIDEYGVPYNYISDFEYKVRNAEETNGKVNVGATLEKAAEQVKSESLESDFESWLEEKEKAYDIEEWLYNGTDNEGRSKWVKNTLDNASRLMKKYGRNAAYTGMGGVGPMIAAVAKRVTTREQIRKEKKNLATTVEEHDAFREKWSESMLELVKKCYDGDLWVGEARLQEALGEKNPIAHLKKEYGVELSKENQELLNTFIKEVRENYPTGYFETKFERPVGLDEFAVAVVPEGTSADVVKALKDAGLDVRTYDGTEEGRQRAAMEAVGSRDDILFQRMPDDAAENGEKTSSYSATEDEDSDVLFRDSEEEDIEAVNEQFNERLDELDKDRNQKDRVLHLGHPGTFLLNGGIADGEIVMDFDRFVRKSSENYGNSHPFTAEDIKDLPKAINTPIAVFDSASNNDKVILTELKKDGKNFIVAIRTTSRPRKGGVTLEINEITTLYPKNAKGIVKWIIDGRHTQIDKEKALRWIEALRPHVGTPISEEHNSESSPLRDQQRTNLADVDSKELDSAAKVVQNFENPKLSEKNLREREGEATKRLTYEESLAMSRRAGYTKKQHDAWQERAWRHMHEAAESTVERLGLGGRVTIMETPDGLKGRKGKAKGWFDAKTGKIVVVHGNHHSVSDVVKTILHEGVAHYGLRKLFGQHFDQFLDNVYQYGDESVRREIVELAKKHGWDFREATEEYLARLAEDTDFERATNQGWWSKIKSLFLDMLHHIGLGDYGGAILTNNELRYILWRSYENMAEPGRYRNPFREAEDISMQMRLGVGSFDRERARIHSLGRIDSSRAVTAEAATMSQRTGQGVLFRDGESDGTREAYNQAVNTGRKKTARMTSFNFREAFQDALLSVKKLQEVIEQKYGMKLASYEDAWKYENALSSINMQQRKRFIDTLYEPMMKVADKLLKAGASVEELNEYLICKHGLERNRVFAERDAQKEYDALVADGKPADLNALIAEKRERDYSGLTEITGKDDIVEIEAEAEGRVQAFEQKYGSTCYDLWDAINKTTKWTLEKSYRSGMMSKQTYEKVRDMFEWYVPLRGWDAETAEDAYDYMMGDRGAFNGTLKTAEGRTSTADDPLATIGNMGESAILQGNRNILKRRLLNMAMNYPTDVCTVRDMWVVENAQGEWEANFPQIPEDATADEVAQILEQHEADMEALAQQGKAHRQRNSLDIDFHINQRDVPEHAVVAYLNGQQHVVYINGNPRAAQAINGRTGEDNSSKNPIRRLVDFLFKDIKRFYSSAITGYSPNFAVANIVRDLGHCIAMTYVNKGALGMARYVAHLPQSIAYVIKNQVGRGGNAKADRYFKEFVENGGITGYAHLNDVDHWKADNAKRWARLSALKKGRVAPVRGVKAFISALGWFSETLELIPRFNTYWSEREDGKDVATAIKAAKDITVNFNKKGSELTPGVWGAVANTLRYEKMFFNPIVQGLNQFYEAGKAHPVRFAVATLHLPVLGAIAPYVNMLLVEAFGGGDGDDDKDKYDYWLQNEYTRRNNVLLFTGKGYVKIPIAPGFRELYGMGEALATRMFGKADNMETARALADQLRTVFSVEGQSSYREWSMSRFILPEHLAPLVDIMNNENFTGGTLYYENQYREHEPEYQKAKQSTWSPLVSASKQLNEWLGGDEDIAAPLSGKWMNPAVWQHLISNYGGGFSQLVGDVTSTASNFIEGKEQDASQWPMLKRFYMKPTVERAQWARYGQYKKYKEDYDLAKEKYSAIRKKDLGPMEEAEAVDAFARRFPRAAAIYSAWEGGVRGADYVNRLQRLKKAGEEDEYWQLIKEAVEAAERATKKGTGESEEENDERP